MPDERAHEPSAAPPGDRVAPGPHRNTLADHEDNHIGSRRARQFVAALRSFEQDGDVSGLLAQFGDGATVSRLDGRGERTDVETFWREYRDRFSRVSTTFRNAVEGCREVALEWDSDVVVDGGALTYRGVTVLAIDPRSDVVTAARMYDGSAAPADGPTAHT